MINRYVIFDTSVVVNDPASIFKLGDKTLGIVPATVIEELNSLKTDTERLRGLTAQKVLTYLDELTEMNPELVTTGMELENGGLLLVEMNHISYVNFKGNFNEKTEDNTIIAVAKNYTEQEKEKNSGIEVVLFTNDVGMRVKARSLGVKAEGYDADKVIDSLDEVYKGYFETFVTTSVIDHFYEHGLLDLNELELDIDREPYINEFIILIDEFNGKNKTVGRVKFESRTGRKMLHKLFITEEMFFFGIHALDIYQLICLELLLDDTVPFVSIIGKAGTGKTLLSLAAGMHKLNITKNSLSSLEESSGDKNKNNNKNKTKNKKNDIDSHRSFKRILALRAMVEVGNKKVGYLPGELESKLKPFMQPYYDNLEFLFDNLGNNDNLEKILAELEGDLQIESTGFMRGRTLPGLFIIVDEAQNLTKHEVKTLITRVGKKGKLVLMGDPSQIDDPYLDSINNGLIYATERMKEYNITGTVLLTGKSKRSDLAELASNVL